LHHPSHILNWHNPEIARQMISGTPLDWAEVFGNSNPLDLEIGIGNGSFLVPFAKDHPARNVVGVEIEGQYLRKADGKLTRQNVTNAKLLIGDAKLLVWKLFADESVEDIYINYPDPWFKKRHLKRRVINPVSLRLFAQKMRSVLTIATDDEAYRDFVIDCIQGMNCFENLFPNFFVNMLDDYYPTKYERKWKEQGKPVFYLKFRKVKHPELDIEEYIDSQNLRFALEQLTGKTRDPMAVLAL
jgi:tRNA (guanine-N7-)-methyltransferase